MSKLFKNPQVGDYVILKNGVIESRQRIVKVGARQIRVSSCNVYKFNRDGKLCRQDAHNRINEMSITPIDCNTPEK